MGGGKVITIDGPAGSGKSTTARMVAEKLGYTYLDTGAMYRAVTLAMIENKIEPDEPDAAGKLLLSLNLDIRYSSGEQRTFLNGRDVSQAIRSVEVTRLVSRVAGLKQVREFLVEQQRAIGRKGRYVVDGRDAGSVIFPDADHKFFLTASLESRARRRQKDLKAQGVDMSLDDLIPEIHRRDELDSSRAESPLIKPVGAVEIDNSHISVEDQVNLIVEKVVKP